MSSEFLPQVGELVRAESSAIPGSVAVRRVDKRLRSPKGIALRLSGEGYLVPLSNCAPLGWEPKPGTAVRLNMPWSRHHGQRAKIRRIGSDRGCPMVVIRGDDYADSIPLQWVEPWEGDA